MNTKGMLTSKLTLRTICMTRTLLWYIIMCYQAVIFIPVKMQFIEHLW